MLDENKRRLINESFKLVVPIAETAADLFYARLFELRPEYRSLFPPDMAKQKRKLVTMLAFIVKSLDYRDRQWREDISVDLDLFHVTLALGRRHTELYHVPEDSYPVVGEALLWTLNQGLGAAFTPDVQEAWTDVYVGLSTTMKLGARSQVDRDFGGVAVA
jgi:hemoglobin-like flavoprotein